MGELTNARDAIKKLKGDLTKVNSAINKNAIGTAKDKVDDLLKQLDKAAPDELKFEKAKTTADNANQALVQACKDLKAALQTLSNGDKPRASAAQEAIKWIAPVLDAYNKQKLKDDAGSAALRQIATLVMKVNSLSQGSRTAPSYCP